jgi:hypothetical protein
VPKQVHLRSGHLTSYRCLQTLHIYYNALAIRILFPLLGVTSVSFNRAGASALLGKQKNELQKIEAHFLLNNLKN